VNARVARIARSFHSLAALVSCEQSIFRTFDPARKVDERLASAMLIDCDGFFGEETDFSLCFSSFRSAIVRSLASFP